MKQTNTNPIILKQKSTAKAAAARDARINACYDIPRHRLSRNQAYPPVDQELSSHLKLP